MYVAMCICTHVKVYIHILLFTIHCDKCAYHLQNWFIEMEAKQNATKPWEDPVMLVEDIEQKGRAVQRETRYMVSRLMKYGSRPKGYGRYNTSRNSSRRNTTSKWRLVSM